MGREGVFGLEGALFSPNFLGGSVVFFCGVVWCGSQVVRPIKLWVSYSHRFRGFFDLKWFSSVSSELLFAFPCPPVLSLFPPSSGFRIFPPPLSVFDPSGLKR